jgi:hypothetical protein
MEQKQNKLRGVSTTILSMSSTTSDSNNAPTNHACSGILSRLHQYSTGAQHTVTKHKLTKAKVREMGSDIIMAVTG